MARQILLPARQAAATGREDQNDGALTRTSVNFSTALQDHYSKSINLFVSNKRRNRSYGYNPAENVLSPRRSPRVVIDANTNLQNDNNESDVRAEQPLFTGIPIQGQVDGRTSRTRQPLNATKRQVQKWKREARLAEGRHRKDVDRLSRMRVREEEANNTPASTETFEIRHTGTQQAAAIRAAESMLAGGAFDTERVLDPPQRPLSLGT